MPRGRDTVALVLAAGVVAVVLAVSIGVVVVHGVAVVTAPEGQLLGTIIGGMVAAVAAYLGVRNGKDDDEPEK